MLLALAALAHAGPPPGVDLDDLDRWETLAGRALDGPAGCWDLEGDVALRQTGFAAPSLFRRADRAESTFGGTFHGRLDGGRWTSFEYTLARTSGSEDSTELEAPLWPMVGRIDPSVPHRIVPDEEAPSSSLRVEGGSGEGMNLLRHTLDLIDPATSTATAEWRDSEASVRVLQDVPVDDAANADVLAVSTRFPGGGDQATDVDVVFPRRMRGGTRLLRVTVYDAQFHLRAQRVGERVLPAKESVSLGLSVLGFTIGYEQALTYRRATPCAPAEPPGP
ncbi:MAG: hypothetical protein R3F59_04455 [Myxococcota bacterium]